MAADLVLFKVYDVGQGACNFIEIYDQTDHGKPTSTILIDLGSRLRRSTAATPAVNAIATTLKSMTNPTIDTLLFTHSDDDHINQILKLLDQFKGPRETGTKPTLGINEIYYGGKFENYAKGGTNFLNRSLKYLNHLDGPVAVGPDQEGFNTSTYEWEFFRTVNNEVELFLIAGNVTNELVDLVAESDTLPDAPSEAYALNMVSLVVAVTFANIEVIFTGDATGLTMARCNQVFTLAGQAEDTFMATLPHHGSADTALDLLGLSTSMLNVDELAEQNVKDFASYLNAPTVSVSAERHDTYKHPSARLISYFWANLDNTKSYYADPALSPANRHFYTAYFTPSQYNAAYKDVVGNDIVEAWPSSYNWYTAQTPANIFSTLYFVVNRQNVDSKSWAAIVPPASPDISVTQKLAVDYTKLPPPPALGTTWEFSVTSGGVKTVRPIVNRAKLLAAGLPFGILGIPPPAPDTPISSLVHSVPMVTPGRASTPRRGAPGLRHLVQIP